MTTQPCCSFTKFIDNHEKNSVHKLYNSLTNVLSFFLFNILYCKANYWNFPLYGFILCCQWKFSVFLLYWFWWQWVQGSPGINTNIKLTIPFLDGSVCILVSKITECLQVIDKLLFTASPKQVAMTQFYWSNKPTIQYMGSTQSRFGTYIGE